MTQVSKHPVSVYVEKRIYKIFIDSIKNTRTDKQVISLLNDLLSKTEKIMLSKRIAIAVLLEHGDYTYREISKMLRVSLGTVEKIKGILLIQGEGYRRIIHKVALNKELNNLLGEMIEVIKPLPSKGANWSRWYKQRRTARFKRLRPL